MTRVKFVIFQKELLAIFPDEQFNHWNKDTVTCYQTVGQHGEASKSLLRCKAATKDQYSDLLKELVAIGYDDLKVMNKEKELIVIEPDTLLFFKESIDSYNKA
jgi:hypothetical protein